MLNLKKAAFSSKESPKYKLSSNTLFHFTKNLDYLMEIISGESIYSRYVKENIEYLNLNSKKQIIKNVAFPMICFCDINLHELQSHVERYGKFGIGLDKQWSIQKNIDPIHYLNKDSSNTKLFSDALNAVLNGEIDTEVLGDELLTQLAISKPLFGSMGDSNNLINFHDEQEWRYIPDFDDESNEFLPFIDDVNNQNLMGEFSLINLSNSLKGRIEAALRLDWNSVKYIFVEDNKSKDVVENFLLANKSFSDKTKMDISSKLLVLNDLKEDW